MNKQLKNLMKRIDKDGFALVKDGNLVKEIVKKPQIKKLRQTDQLFIGNDRNKKTTIIFKKPPF